jgi:hypothetical protein
LAEHSQHVVAYVRSGAGNFCVLVSGMATSADGRSSVAIAGTSGKRNVATSATIMSAFAACRRIVGDTGWLAISRPMSMMHLRTSSGMRFQIRDGFDGLSAV